MNSKTPAFDPLTLPLSGKQLVEASAGTGKTHNISNLFLRGVLGVGLERPLHVQDILVVTFTKAACAELKTRIRQRLIAARSFLATLMVAEGDEALSSLQEQDDFLFAIAKTWSQQQLTLALVQLELAARSIDESAIYTIHGFCQRALQDSAFLFALPFEQTLNEDVLNKKNSLFRDWWRTLSPHYSDFEKQLMAENQLVPSWLFKKRFNNIAPEVNLSLSGVTLTALDKTSESKDYLQGIPAEKVQLFLDKLAKIRKLWPDAKAALQEYTGAKSNVRPFNKLNENLMFMDEFLNSGELNLENYNLYWSDFSQENITKAKAAKQEPLEHPAFELISELADMWTEAYEQTLLRLACDYREFLGEKQLTEHELDFDRLISLLNEKMQCNQHHLKQLALNYPLIMVDEFQDTDQDQFEIFNALADAGSCLLMIGDPKQAIYKFRGADIYAYLAAKQQAKVWTMETNWRSSDQLVQAVNTLFTQRDNIFLEQEIPFDPVNSAGKADEKPFTVDGQKQAAISLRLVGKAAKWSSFDNLKHTATQVVELLASNAKVGDVPLSAGEVSVLVRSNSDARRMQELLAQKGVASILISDDSVFETSVAHSLLLVLKAMLEKDRMESIFSALASGMTAYDVDVIRQIQKDTLKMGELQQVFSQAANLWQRFGISVAMRHLLKSLGIPQYLLSLPEGQRELANLIHVLELLQNKSRELPGVNALYDWFALQVLDENRDGASDEEKIKLETDHQLVKIATIHRSKGLQYDVVFIPKLNFVGQQDYMILSHQQGEKNLYLRPTEKEKGLAKQETLAEDMRLVYVALTRARHKIFANIVRQPQVGIENSAVGLMLNLEKDDDCNYEILKSLQDYSIELEYISAAINSEAAQIFATAQNQQQPLQLRQWPVLRSSWRVNSFSSITANLAHASVTGLANIQLDDSAANDEVGAIEAEPVEQSEDFRFRFTKGAEAGNFIHAVFESYLLQEKRDKQTLEAIIEKHWGEYQLRMELQANKTFIVNWFSEVLATELLPGQTLERLPKSACLPEMEFFLANANEVSAKKLNAVLEQFSYQTEPQLDFVELKGFLKGFIDLIFEHKGKFYVLDYKSNFLGAEQVSYQQENMYQAIRHHHYQLQYILYTFALHRFLKMQLPDYDYEKHIGGAIYLFVRGMFTGSDTGIFKDQVPKALIEALEQLFSGAVK